MIRNLLLKQMLIPVLLIAFSCKKQSVNSNNGAFHEEEVAVKTEGWKVYPYSGGPGADSMYSVLSPSLPNYYQSKNLISVRIKKKDGTIVPARELVSVLQKDDVYLYQPGDLLSTPSKVLFWWVQKSAGSVPDADSALVKFRY
jgi:hypothetical protein